MNQHMGRETLKMLDAIQEGCLPAGELDDLGARLVELGQELRHRAAEIATEIDGEVLQDRGFSDDLGQAVVIDATDTD